jgi:hypothetical protein
VASQTGQAQQPARQRGLLVIYSALMLAMLLVALDQTIVATALPTIVSDLGGLSHLSWVVTAYILATTATTQVWGKLGDQYGRKYLFMASIVIFLVGSAPADGAGFRADLQGRLSAQCADCDGGYPDNADLVIDDQGVPSLKRYRAAAPTPTALALEAAITLTTFTYGSNLGPAQAARHMAGVSAHELGATARRHATIGKLNLAITDVVDAFSELDLARAWGDGATAAADGTQVETFVDNLLAETSIRYGTGAGSRTTTSPTPTSRCSPGSSRSGCGRRSTSSRACCSRSRRSGRARSTPTRRASRSRCSRSRTCSDST